MTESEFALEQLGLTQKTYLTNRQITYGLEHYEDVPKMLIYKLYKLYFRDFVYHGYSSRLLTTALRTKYHL